MSVPPVLYPLGQNLVICSLYMESWKNCFYPEHPYIQPNALVLASSSIATASALCSPGGDPS